MKDLRILLLVCAVGASSVARADPGAAVHHVPPTEAELGEALRLVAVIDDAWKEGELVARYRVMGSRSHFADASFERSSAGGYYATIPARSVSRPGVEYYIVGVRRGAGEVEHFGSSDAPHPVRVEPPARLRWIEAEKRRIAGRRSRIRTDLRAVDFGGVDGARDLFGQVEVDWTYRLVTTLYSINLGFGALEGKTPSGLEGPVDELDRGVRYGYGGVRLRMAPSVWADARAIIGFGREGFISGVGGQLVLGKEWRTAVSLGAEYVEELGPQARVRVQWDTVPPFLMGLAVTLSNWPDANLKSGSYVEYDVSYALSEQLRLTGRVSFAARGNRPGGLGAGLATTFEF
jgi:hypothetical protein